MTITSIGTADRLKHATSIAPRIPKARSAHWRRKINRQRVAAYGIGVVALVLMVLSLSHLAFGVEVLTGSASWHAWAMAVGIDLGFIALEIGQLCVNTESLRRNVAKWADPAVKATLAVSALMNAYAFAHHGTWWPFMLAGCALGIAIPVLIYVLTRVAVAMWIDAHKV